MTRHLIRASLALLLVATVGATHALAQQSCPDGSFSAGGGFATLGPLDTNLELAGGFCRFAPTRDSAMAAGGGSTFMSFNAPVRYQFVGLATSVPLTMTLNVTFDLDVRVILGDPGCKQNYVTASVLLDDAILAEGSDSAKVVQSSCVTPHSTVTLSRTITRPIGVPFTLEIRVQGRTTTYGNIKGSARLDLTRNPPGGFLMRCDGYTFPGTLDVSPEARSGLRIGDLFPNPAHGEFRARVFVPTGGTAFLRILDLTGRIVHSRTVEASGSVRELSFKTGLAPGRYFMQLSQGSHTAVRPVVLTD